jgi:hypothetical protein
MVLQLLAQDTLRTLEDWFEGRCRPKVGAGRSIAFCASLPNSIRRCVLVKVLSTRPLSSFHLFTCRDNPKLSLHAWIEMRSRSNVTLARQV